MAVDKGMTKAYLQSIGRHAKKGEEFNLTDLNGGVDTTTKSSVTMRFVKHGIIERISTGRYKLLVDEPWSTYKERINAWKHGPRKKRGRYNRVIPAITAKPNGGPEIKIIPYGDYEMIFIGRRIFLATEVALTPKGRKAE
jgi:hypothetical protein